MRPSAVDLRLRVGDLLFGVPDRLIILLFRIAELFAFVIELLFGGGDFAVVFALRVIELRFAVSDLCARVVKLRFRVGDFVPVFLLAVLQLLFRVAQLIICVSFFCLIGFLCVVELRVCLVDDLDLKRFLAFFCGLFQTLLISSISS